MPSLSVNQKVSSTASTMPAGQSYASNSPESAVATIGARPAPAAETRTILVAHMTSIVTATKSPSAFGLLPATTTSPAPDTIISGELGKRQPQWPSGPVPSSIMSHDGMAPELSIDGCSSRRSVYLSAISSGVPSSAKPCTFSVGMPKAAATSKPPAMHGRDGIFSLAKKMCILLMSKLSLSRPLSAATTEPPGMQSEKEPFSSMQAEPT